MELFRSLRDEWERRYVEQNINEYQRYVPMTPEEGKWLWKRTQKTVVDKMTSENKRRKKMKQRI